MTAAPTHGPPAAARSPHRLSPGAIAWLIAVGLLPLAELGLLSALFDASAIAERGGWVAHVIGASGDVVRAAPPVLIAALLVGAARLPALAPALRATFAAPRRPWAALAGQIACFSIVVALSGRVFAGPAPSGGLLAVWAAAGLAAAALWVVALIPGVHRRGPGWLIGGTLLVGAAVGMLASGAAAVTRDWWAPLGRSTVWTVYWMLRALGFDAGADAAQFFVGTPSFVVEITPYCSGYQGIGLMWAFLGAYLWLFRDRLRFPRALWLLPIGTVLVWVLNAVRIVVLVIIGTHGHEEIATQGFHYHAGTLLFCGAALGLGAWASGSRVFGTTAASTPSADTVRDGTAAHVLPFVVLLLTALVTGAASRDGFDAWYGVRILTTAAVLWMVRGRLAGDGWTVSWPGVLFGITAFVLWLALVGRGASDAQGNLGAALGALDPASRALWIAARVLGAVVIVPLVEELAFRGYLARRLTGADWESLSLRAMSWPALLASSVLFGLLHRDVIAGTVAGVLYALAARRRGQLGDAVLAHAVTNALLAVTVLTTGRWTLWE
jgi:exosortase E/protease (VPEID-CTERM system)